MTKSNDSYAQVRKAALAVFRAYRMGKVDDSTRMFAAEAICDARRSRPV
jgi:hypothetical protein